MNLPSFFLCENLKIFQKKDLTNVEFCAADFNNCCY